MSESFLNGKVILHRGDCLEVLRELEENSIDSCVCDPPYHLTSIVKRFGAENAAPCKIGKTGAYARASKGFMGKVWDGGDIAFNPLVWELVFRALKPGAHLLAFGGTRTYHRLASAIDAAGFEVRDALMWHFGSGFPKSHDVSKALDRMAGAEREVVGRKTGRAATPVQDMRGGSYAGGNGKNSAMDCSATTAPATPEAEQWQGWGTALKPATEIICLARKPLSEKSVAANVLKHGTGAINVDGCRVGTEATLRTQRGTTRAWEGGAFTGDRINGSDLGRFPANLIHDGSEEVLEGFPETSSAMGNSHKQENDTTAIRFNGKAVSLPGVNQHGGSGSAARFFYTAKADSNDRLGSKHPTVKPLDLIQYLVRLVTPRGGTVLDPFAGTGTTGEAGFREGMGAILIERESEYQADIVKRMELVLAGPDSRRAASIKQIPPDDLPMFAREAE